MEPFRRVGLVLGTHGEANRAFARGIAAYARLGRRWIFNAIDLDRHAVPALLRWKPAGIVAVLVDDALGRAVCRATCPVVNVAKLHTRPDLPRVDHDDREIGRLAARHLLDRGFRTFGFVGLPLLPYSLQRQEGFIAELAEAGMTASVLTLVRPRELRNASGWPARDDAVRRWIAQLPRPAGVMICSDWHAWKFTEVVRASGIRVPEDLALVGVDNDEPWPSLAYPPLSSVATNAERIGYEAAALLDRLMSGDERGEAIKPLELPPVGVVARQSSDTVALEDQAVASAVRYIRDNAHLPLRVSDVSSALAMSRRSLERRFRDALQQGIADQITRAHIEKAKDVLARTEAAMPTVASASGFTNNKRFSETFRRITGMTPTAYRNRYRLPR